MIALLYGKDRFRIMRRRAELKDAFRSEHQDGEIVVFDMASGAGSFPKFLFESVAADLFGSRRFLDIENAFSVPEDLSEKIITTVSETDFSPVDGTFSFVGIPKAKDPFFASLKKKADIIEEWKPLTSVEAAAFIVAEAKSVSAGVSFSRPVLERMTALFGTDSAKLSSLARTLATYKESGEIALSDFDLFVSEVPKELVFAALDALVSGNRGRAVTMLLEETRGDSGGVPKLFGLLAWQLRELIKVRGEYDKGNIRPDGIAAACGMKPFVAGKLLSRISGFPLARLRNGFNLLSSLDEDMKLGRKDPELALTLFVEKF
jgi:DNA polymerase III delta subunit